MKTLKFYFAAAVGTAMVIGSASGQDATASPDKLDQFYRADEFSVDAFASGSLGKQYIDDVSGDTLRHHGRLGAGLGANYFITRYIGLGGDVYSENTTGRFIDSASGNLIGRLPIGNTGLAPYIFGGAGHQFEQVQQTFGQAGTGVEIRITPNVGFFVDARYVFPDRTDGYGLARGGMRISF
jgi:hypothetical protein